MKPSSPWTLTAQQVVAQQQTSLDTGLTAAQVQKRREQYGYNELDKEPGKPLWKLVLEQFDDMLVKVATVAAALWFRAAQPVSCFSPRSRTVCLSLCPCAPLTCLHLTDKAAKAEAPACLHASLSSLTPPLAHVSTATVCPHPRTDPAGSSSGVVCPRVLRGGLSRGGSTGVHRAPGHLADPGVCCCWECKLLSCVRSSSSSRPSRTHRTASGPLSNTPHTSRSRRA